MSDAVVPIPGYPMPPFESGTIPEPGEIVSGSFATPLVSSSGGGGGFPAGIAGQILITDSSIPPAAVWKTPSGDAVVSSAAAFTVTGLRGQPLPVLSAGVLQYTGSAWSLGAVSGANLGTITLTGDTTGSAAGGSIVTTTGALQGVSVSAAAPTNTQVLQYDSGTGKWTPVAITSVSALTVYGADLATSTSTQQYVSSISGSNGLGGSVPVATASWFNWPAGAQTMLMSSAAVVLDVTAGGAAELRGVTAGQGVALYDSSTLLGTFTDSASTSVLTVSATQTGGLSFTQAGRGPQNGTAAGISFTPQLPNTLGNSAPGSVTFNLALPTGTGSYPSVAATSGVNELFAIGGGSGFGTFGVLWMGAGPYNGGNYAFAGDAATGSTIIAGQTSLQVQIASTYVVAFSTTELQPVPDVTLTLGDATHRWAELDVQSVTIKSDGVGGNASGPGRCFTFQMQTYAAPGITGATSVTSYQPLIALTGVIGSGNTWTLDLGNNAAMWWIDISALTGGVSGAGTLTLQSGTATVPISVTTAATTANLLVVRTSGANAIAVNGT